MINYLEMQIGDTLKIVGVGAQGYAKNGELVTVTKTTQNSVTVVNKNGEEANFIQQCGAERLEKVQRKEE